MAKIALKVDVDTLRGTKEGVPNLARTLERFGLKATFLFSLGPDHTGWALKRVFKPGFLKKVSRTSVVEHYGIKTLLYGVLLPGPDIGKQAAAEMRAIDAAGHETGIHTWDHVAWQDAVRNRDAQWTKVQMQKSWDRFVEIFGHPPATIRCIIRPAGMTSGNPTTWLGTHVGDLLFYACLVGSEQYLKADERIATWKTEYVERLQAARFELKPETRKDYMPIDAAPTV